LTPFFTIVSVPVTGLNLMVVPPADVAPNPDVVPKGPIYEVVKNTSLTILCQ